MVTVNSSGANLVLAMAANTSAIFTSILNTGTSAASWNASYIVDAGGGVSPGNVNELAYYAVAGNNVSGLTTANNGILVTSSGGVPSIGNTVGAGLIMPSITFNSTSGIIGTTTNDNAAAGSVGSLVESEILVGSAVSLTSTTAANITSISLTAGDWDVWGNCVFLPDASTPLTSIISWISTTSATLPTLPNAGAESLIGTSMTVGTAQALTAGSKRLSLSATTTVYLSCRAVFTISTATAYGYIGARRRR